MNKSKKFSPEVREREVSLGSFVKACVEAGRMLYGEEWSQKEFVQMANAFRNDLKHCTDGEIVTVPREAAVAILDRAIDNLWAQTARQTPSIRRFMEEVHGM